MMTEYCDIEFTLKGSSSNAQRHVAFVINGDGSDTTSNFDLLVFRTNTGSPSSNQIRLDKIKPWRRLAEDPQERGAQPHADHHMSEVRGC